MVVCVDVGKNPKTDPKPTEIQFYDLKMEKKMNFK